MRLIEYEILVLGFGFVSGENKGTHFIMENKLYY